MPSTRGKWNAATRLRLLSDATRRSLTRAGKAERDARPARREADEVLTKHGGTAEERSPVTPRPRGEPGARCAGSGTARRWASWLQQREELSAGGDPARVEREYRRQGRPYLEGPSMRDLEAGG